MEIAVLWARVSTKEQSEEGYSLDSQVRMLRNYASINSLRILKEFIIPESASGKQERKKFQEMLQYLRDNPKIQHILFEKVDRATRNFKDSVKLNDWLNGQL